MVEKKEAPFLRGAICPVCSEHFDEKEGFDVDKGEVCCSKHCATEFDYDPDLYAS
jgi:YHS domain-containing protein